MPFQANCLLFSGKNNKSVINLSSAESVHSMVSVNQLGLLSFFKCLFVLRFYGPVNPMGSCRAWSVYLTTRLLGRLSPLSD